MTTFSFFNKLNPTETPAKRKRAGPFKFLKCFKWGCPLRSAAIFVSSETPFGEGFWGFRRHPRFFRREVTFFRRRCLFFRRHPRKVRLSLRSVFQFSLLSQKHPLSASVRGHLRVLKPFMGLFAVLGSHFVSSERIFEVGCRFSDVTLYFSDVNIENLIRNY